MDQGVFLEYEPERCKDIAMRGLRMSARPHIYRFKVRRALDLVGSRIMERGIMHDPGWTALCVILSQVMREIILTELRIVIPEPA